MPSTYLTFEDVLGIYGDLYGCTSQEALDRLREPSILEGACARPRQYAAYAEADLALQAATLAHGIAEGQAFLDGNKRTALVSMETFLLLNGQCLTASNFAVP